MGCHAAWETKPGGMCCRFRLAARRAHCRAVAEQRMVPPQCVMVPPRGVLFGVSGRGLPEGSSPTNQRRAGGRQVQRGEGQ